MIDLSPAAQAVMKAAAAVYWDKEYWDEEYEVASPIVIAAAALRAAADQVAPDDAVEPRNNLPMAMECQRIRRELLAIAAELEGQ